MPDPKERIVVDGVEFGTVFRFPRILRSITGAMQPPKLVIALLMVVTLSAFGRTWDAITEPAFRPGGLLNGTMSVAERAEGQEFFWSLLTAYEIETPGPRDQLEPLAVAALLREGNRSRRAEAATSDGMEIDERFAEDLARVAAFTPRGVFESLLTQWIDCQNRAVRGVVDLRPDRTYDAVVDLLAAVPVALWRSERRFVFAYGLVFLVVMAIGGGAISRMTACESARSERLRVRQAFDFAFSVWPRLIGAPVLPLVVAGGLALLLIGFGLLFAPWLDVVGGALYGAAVVLGFLVAFLVLGYAAALPLLVPAVACENCDAGDALQRGYAYVLARPLHLLGYAVTALVGFAIGYLVVALVASFALNVTATLTGLIFDPAALTGAGGFRVFDLTGDPATAASGPWHAKAGGVMIAFWERLVIDLVAAYVVAYFFSATTNVYLLMRQACDGQDVEEIWTA